MGAIEKFRGMSVVLSADLADISHDVNLRYPNGIGKAQGLRVLEDTGTIFRIVMARGSATDSTWTPVDERTDADISSDTITPS